MKHKLKEYIEAVFADAQARSPQNKRLAELKEEMLCNLEEKYDDLIAAGRTPAAAYNIAVAGVGDISDLLDSVAGAAPAAGSTPVVDGTSAQGALATAKRPLSAEERARVEKWNGQSALRISGAVALYILSVLPCMLLDSLAGPAILFVMIAAATALLIFNAVSKPKFDKTVDWDRNDDDDDDGDDGQKNAAGTPSHSPVYRAISCALWILGSVAYVLISLLTGYWHITWMIFLILTAADGIIKAIFDLRR